MSAIYDVCQARLRGCCARLRLSWTLRCWPRVSGLGESSGYQRSPDWSTKKLFVDSKLKVQYVCVLYLVMLVQVVTVS